MAGKTQDPSAWRRTVIVEGFDEDITLDIIELLFEDHEETGGGAIESVSLDRPGRAVVVYEEEGVAASVLERRHTIGDRHVTVSRPETLPEKPPAEGTSVEVHGLKPILNEKVLKVFFSNPEKSGGGPVERVLHEPGDTMAVVQFSSSADADRVIAIGLHSLGGCNLVAKEPSTIPPQVQTASVNTESSPVPAARPMYLPMNTQAVTKTTPTSSTPSNPINCTIQASGIPADANEQILELFFESNRYSGGGPVARLDYTPRSGRALVTFRDASDASNVLKRGALSFDKTIVTVQELTPAVSTKHFPPELEPPSLGVAPADTPPLTAVRISGIPPTISCDFLRLFLEQKQNADCSVLDIQYTEGSGQATVSLANQKHAEGLTRERLVLDGSVLDIRLLDTRPSTEMPYAVLVSNICPTASSDFLWLFFDSERNSGGSGVIDVEFDEEKRTAVITYEDPAVVRKVLSRQQLTLGNQQAFISPLPRAPLVPLAHGQVLCDGLIVSGIPPKCEKQTLMDFLEKHSQNNVLSVTYGVQVPYVALVIFCKNIDYKQIQLMCARYPLKGSLISVQQVNKVDSVQVHGIENLSTQSVELYFESPRVSGGGPVKNLVDHQKSGYAIIQFEEPETFHSVMRRQKHVFEGTELRVRPYITELGVLPPDHNTLYPPAYPTEKGLPPPRV